jgi:hypothetical protein
MLEGGTQLAVRIAALLVYLHVTGAELVAQQIWCVSTTQMCSGISSTV